MFANFFVNLTLVALLYPVGLTLLAIKEIFVYGIDPKARRLGKIREVVRYFLYEFGILDKHPISKRGKYRRQPTKLCVRKSLKPSDASANPLLAWPLTLVTTVDEKTGRLVRRPWQPDTYLD